jgi:hypothetical protein
MDLEFVNRRVIEPAGALPAWGAYEAAARSSMGIGPADAGTVGTAGSTGTVGTAGDDARTMTPTDLTDVDRRQLVAAVSSVYGAEGLTVDAFFAGESDDETDEVRHLPIEWWDVVDASGVPVYQLWLCHVDCGTLFAAGSTDEAAYVAQFHVHDFAGDGAALESARVAAVARHPGSMLASLHV